MCDFSLLYKERPPSADTGKVAELQKYLDEALAAKVETEAKLTKLQTAVQNGKLDPDLVILCFLFFFLVSLCFTTNGSDAIIVLMLLF